MNSLHRAQFWKVFPSKKPFYLNRFFISFSSYFGKCSLASFFVPKTQIYAQNVDLACPFGFPRVPKSTPGPRKDPAERVSTVFRHSLFPYLALHPTSHHLFFMLSHWVSVSAGNPAIAVARKVGVLGAPEIENGYPLLLPKLLLFSTFSKNCSSLEFTKSPNLKTLCSWNFFPV